MPAINYRELSHMVEGLGLPQTVTMLGEALEKKELKANDFSLRDLAESLVPDGREWVRSLNPNKSGGFIQEASQAVNTAAFSNITGQIAYSAIIEAYTQAGFIGDQLCTVVPTRFNGEKIPGVSNLGDVAAIVDEGSPYRPAGVAEDYIETPITTKRGFTVPVTKEAVFFDRTNLVLDRCSKVGEALGINREKRIIDAVIDHNVTTHRYKWRGGTAQGTYQSTSNADHPWINIKTSNALVDWTDVDNAEQIFSGMTDPYTGEPILVIPSVLLCCPELLNAARRVVNAVEIRFGDGASSTTQTVARNPISSYNIVTSPFLKARLAAASEVTTHWYLGNPKKMVHYMENWPITVVSAPSNSESEFRQDIVAEYKASERGATAVVDPRQMVKNTVA